MPVSRTKVSPLLRALRKREACQEGLEWAAAYATPAAAWRHPVRGVLTVAGVAELLRVDRTTVHRWTVGKRLPPLWALDELRELLREYRP